MVQRKSMRSNKRRTIKRRKAIKRRKSYRSRGGRININNCPPNGYHIYLRTMHPADRIEVTCAQLQERINANVHERIFIETPGPHDDDNERETVTWYRLHWDNDRYIEGRVSRPDALEPFEPEPAPWQPGDVPRRMHRQYGDSGEVSFANLINHITQVINADIAERAEHFGFPGGNNMNINN